MPPLRVVLLRHADAVNGAEAGSDFARVLTRKGEAQARRIGRALLAHGFLPDAVAASPAPRA
ncbi:MAG TPA: histidine phosphatase family protein, partial [Candidatus Thermoplasmatota archaeon]|nr:histidine phosphatase family protein [Candidatus Thermoplasmatota archaeon]